MSLSWRRIGLLAWAACAAAPSPGLGAAAGDDAERLDQMVVLSGQLPTGEQPGSVLSEMDVLLTPGANADINRTLQLLPGVQQVDEGNALYVRGGASDETITRVNGLVFPSPISFAAPTGSFAESLDVFEARHVDFSSGAFDAGIGNALSGVVDIDTMGAPRTSALNLGAGLGVYSAAAGAALGSGGFQATASRTDVGPILSLNGSSRDFPDPPNGTNLGFSAGVEYRPDAEIKLFAVDQSLRFSVLDYEPGNQGLFSQSDFDRFFVLSWKDHFGPWTAELSAGGGSIDQEMTGPDFSFATRRDHRQAAGRLRYQAGDRLEWSVGFDSLRESSDLLRGGTAADVPSGGELSFAVPDSRWGAYTVLDAVPAANLRLVVSARTDRSTLTERATADPRVSLAWQAAPSITLFAAGGAYRQIPDPLDFFNEAGRVALPPMQDRQASGGMEWKRSRAVVRVEAYRKNYSDLVALNDSYLPVPFGNGYAQGVDFYVKSPLPGGLDGRLTYSYVDSLRTDPNTGALAPPPFDVNHTASLVLERSWGKWTASAAQRAASGRPFTPVAGALPDGDGGFTPVYGAPGSERLPPFWRTDLEVTHRSALGQRVVVVEYVSVDNLFNRDNSYAYGYPPDYASRFLVPGLFNRTLFFGATLIYR